MAKKKFFEKFDQGTLLKLKLLESYFKSWLPVFIQHTTIDQINVFDFFCGPGVDKQNNYGSPLVILKTLEYFSEMIDKQSVNVDVYFSDSKKKYVDKLYNNLVDQSFELKNVSVHMDSVEFENQFRNKMDHMSKRGAANFLFMDPFGVALTPEMFKKLMALRYTDFLLFTPSAHFWRFKDSCERVKSVLPNFKLKEISAKEAHKEIFRIYKGQIPNNVKYYLAPFTIEDFRHSNVAGLIFGSKDLRGLEKFVDVCWEYDEQNGECGIGLKSDLLPTQTLLPLGEYELSSKKRRLRKLIVEGLSSGKLVTNKDVFELAITRGLRGGQAKQVLTELKREKKVENIPPLSYNYIYRKHRVERILWCEHVQNQD
jgi:three-Cys-motif partner protein